jgi:hypothetical protein
MDFFNAACQSGPFDQAQFGLCDDQDAPHAYVDTTTPTKWVATVENPSLQAVTFTAIDKCVIRHSEEQARGRCDGMLTTEDQLYLVELKDQRVDWRPHAIAQLESTILFLRQHHAADLDRFRHKKAFACNRRHPSFAVIDHEQKRRFFQNYGFRIDIQATVRVLPVR